MRLRFTKSYKPKADLNDQQAVNDEVLEHFLIIIDFMI